MQNFFEERIDEISDSIAPPLDGAEDEYVLLKITDNEGKVIGGCIAGVSCRSCFDIFISLR